MAQIIYDKTGEIGFLPQKRNKSYAKECKDTIVIFIKKLKDYSTSDVYMTNSRKTTVQGCIEHSMQYKLAVKKYGVSYTQVYQWTKKYLEAGGEGLLDKRGKHKTDEGVDAIELLVKKLAQRSN